MVIYETIGGRLPFHQHADLTVFVKVLAGKRPTREAGFGESLWKMVTRCWAPQPKVRPSIQDVLQCLDTVSSRSELPLSGLDEEIEEDEDEWDGWDDSSGMVPPFIPLRRLVISAASIITEVEAPSDEDLDIPSDFFRVSFIHFGSLDHTENLDSAEQVESLDISTDDHSIPGTRLSGDRGIGQSRKSSDGSSPQSSQSIPLGLSNDGSIGGGGFVATAARNGELHEMSQ